MNEELQNALAEIITSALQTAETAKEFVLAEMPDVIHQLLMWKAVESVLFFMAGVAILLVVATYWIWVVRRWDAINEDEDDGDAVFGIGGGMSAFFIPVALITMFSNLEWLQIWIAPKVYLLEYAANLVK